MPGELIATTESYVIPPGPYENSVVTLEFSDGPIDMTAGTFVLVINEPIDPDVNDNWDINSQIVTTSGQHRNNTWVNWPTNPEGTWVKPMGTSNFEVFYLRALFFRDVLFVNGFE